MDEQFKIFIEPLKGGKSEKLDLSCDPDFLGISEEALHFESPVKVRGEAYVADTELILHFDAETHAILPCSICNNPVKVLVEVKSFYHVEPLSELKYGFFNYQEILREALLLEVPAFAECEQGNCPQRQQIAKYLKSPKTSDGEGHQPFADINLDQFKP